MEYAADLQFYRNRQKRGLSSPLDDLKPVQDELVVWFLDTFRLLEHSRQPEGLIPLSEVLIFSDYFDLMCPLDQFVRTVVKMDETVLQHRAEQRKKHGRQHSGTGRTKQSQS